MMGSVLRKLGGRLNWLLGKIGLKIIFAKNGYRTGIGNSKIAKRIFANRTLEYSKSGYYYVDPMPSQDELNLYYSKSYWSSRGGVNNSYLRKRDLVHIYMINDLVKPIDSYTFDTPKTVLNFGSGHGGISHLYFLQGHKIINIEPNSDLFGYKSSNWTTLDSIDEVPDNSIEFFYSSHSLEHVQSIEKVMNTIAKKLVKDALVFLEVPNGLAKENGAQKNSIDIPHTYYFTKEFFNKKFDKIYLNEVFDTSSKEIFSWKCFITNERDGNVIRFLGSNIRT